MPFGSALRRWLLSRERRFLFLLIFLVVFLFLGPFITTEDKGLSVYDGLFTGVLILGAYSASQKKAFLVIALAILLPAVALVWLDHFDPSTSYALARLVLAILFFTYIGGTILSHVLKAERVTFDKICAALCSYLLLGLIFALLYSFLEFLDPGTFLAGGEIIPQGDPRAFYGAGLGQAIYFSFTTLTTLGYGDITGATAVARNLSVLEAIIGQIYLVVLVARLVGLGDLALEQRDLFMTQTLEQKQTERYDAFFRVFRKCSDQISAVVFWGLSDPTSWLRTQPDERDDGPLLFDENYEPKKAYWAVMDF